jgi:hypothetical protein
VNSKEENSEDFFLDFVQEFGLRTNKSSYGLSYKLQATDKLSFGVIETRTNENPHGLSCDLQSANLSGRC